jgi:phosphatidylethanolamine-binding protein (PEBP) family uncharacterized protein
LARREVALAKTAILRHIDFDQEARPTVETGLQQGRSMTFILTSNSFKDGDYLPNDFILSADYGFGCAGGNKSPHLRWSGAPAATRSFAVTLYDPNAPTGSGFWHWLVVNIPGDVTELAVGAGSRCGDLPPARCRHAPTSGRRATAGPVRPRETIRTAICSRSSP